VLDAISSWWCKSLGHGHPRVRAALEAQLGRFEHVIAAGTTNEPLVRLCERLLAMANGRPAADWGAQARPGRLPGHFGKVFLADNGSTGWRSPSRWRCRRRPSAGSPAAPASPPWPMATTARRWGHSRSATWACTGLPSGP
jgi:hypothetical protein